MARLVEDEEIYGYIGVDKSKDPNGNIPLIRDSIEDILITQTGRDFGPGSTYTDEAYDGFGTDVLHVKRPLAALTKITIVKGFPGSGTLGDYEIDIIRDIVWQIGKRRIAIRDGDTLYRGRNRLSFPRGYGNILISYTSAADQPAMAKQAVREATAAVFRRVGSEDARSEQIGTFQHVLLRNLDESMTFKRAVEMLTIPTMG